MAEGTDLCPLHGEKHWVECWQCGGDGVYGHDCGEDVCCCLYPEENERCDICRGKGGWRKCTSCHPEAPEDL
ncbi:MAG TPA: hypothetical protein VJT81_06800 [Burkholderiales bacterium]|nr:hypothetical protein [Burkholderiales bacterium]